MKRIIYISYLRVFATLSVVYFHSMCCYGAWDKENAIPAYNVLETILNNINMPLFTIVAGCLYGILSRQGHYDDAKAFLRNKFKRLIVPYIIVGSLIVVMDGGRQWTEMLYGISHLWYLLFLFESFTIITICKVLLPPIKLLVSKHIKIVFVGLICWAYCGMKEILPGTPIVLVTPLLRYFPFFLIGMILAKFDIGKRAWGYGLLLALAVAAVSNVVYEFDLTNVGKVARAPYWLVYPFIPIMFFLWVKDKPYLKERKWVLRIDKWSMGIYIMHHLFIPKINQIEIFHDCMMACPLVYPIIVFALSLFLSILVTATLQRTKWGWCIVG